MNRLLGKVGLFSHALVLAAWLLLASAPAATLTVTSLNDSGPGSLRNAINSALNGDTVDATGISGSILLTSGELAISNSLTIVGPGQHSLAVDGNYSNRVFHITGPNTVTISDLTITNGSTIAPSSSGGGIWNDHATVYIIHCAINRNIAGIGGGIYNQGDFSSPASLVIRDSTLNYNRAAEGGGIYNLYSTLAITNSTLGRNSASANSGTPQGGGGICNEQGKLTLAASMLDENSANNSGGGILNHYAQPGLILNSTLTENVAARGGGIYNDATSLTIVGCTVSRNGANNGGGAFNDGAVGAEAAITVLNSTFSQNSAGGTFAGFGGAIYNGNPMRTTSVSLTLLNSTFSDNVADSGAGGLYNLSSGFPGASASITIGSTILSADPSRGNTFSNAVGSVTSQGFNLSSDDAGGHLDQPTDLVNIDPQLGPLWDYGGPTWTHALLFGSPAIDKGKNLSGASIDQRGQVRIYDNPGIQNAASGDGTDIGAVEFIPPALGIRVTTTNTLMVYWPSDSTGFGSQVTTNLDAANWTTSPETIQDDGLLKYIIVNPPFGNRFYRLASP